MTKKFSVLGDSISTLKGYVPETWRIHYEGEVHIDGVTKPADTWWGRVIEHFDGELLSDSSFSGSCMEGYAFPAGCSDERIDHLMGENGEVPDVVLVYIGINDYGWGGARNQVMGGSVSACGKPEDYENDDHEVEGVVGPEALENFKKAYSSALNKIHQRAPQAEVWCLNHAAGTVPGCPWPNFAYRIRGIELDDYNAAIAEAAAENGAHLVDVRGYGVSYDSVDGVHPSALGMKQLAAMVIQQMEGGKVEPEAIPELADAPKSERACYEDSCDGCPHIVIEKHRWDLYCNKFEPKEK